MMKTLYRLSDFLDEFFDWWSWEGPRLILLVSVAGLLGLIVYGLAATWGVLT